MPVLNEHSTRTIAKTPAREGSSLSQFVVQVVADLLAGTTPWPASA